MDDAGNIALLPCQCMSEPLCPEHQQVEFALSLEAKQY